MSFPKFTFKKYRPTGCYASFEKGFTDIKIKKKQVGIIWEREGGKWQIRFTVNREPTKEKPAPFKWIFVIEKFNSEKEAREWIQNNTDIIHTHLDLHYLEN